MIIHFPKKRIWGIGYTLLPIMALLVVGTVIGHTILTSNKAAATTTGFDPSNIISDSVMTASSTMSVDQIQSFLVGKVPICDTGGTLPATDFLGANTTVTHAQYAAQRIAAAQAAGQTTNWTLPPYACLKDYTENGLSSAQIIYNIAQQYQINPEVLIVLLQKEQGLVTDTWPLPIEYTSATGYGCPDNSVCSSQYYGFTNQVTWAAKMYHAIETSSSTWYSPYIRGTIVQLKCIMVDSAQVEIFNTAVQRLLIYKIKLLKHFTTTLLTNQTKPPSVAVIPALLTVILIFTLTSRIILVALKLPEPVREQSCLTIM
jgi:hypothetical protein